MTDGSMIRGVSFGQASWLPSDWLCTRDALMEVPSICVHVVNLSLQNID